MPIVHGTVPKSTAIEHYPVPSPPSTTLRRPAARWSHIRWPACHVPHISAVPGPAGRRARPAWWIFVIAAISCLLASTACAAGEFTLTRQAIAKVEREYGESARERVVRWQELIRSSAGLSDLEKLRRVNDFFNKLDFISDIEHWGKEDYWATPLETLVSNGGDCEDFSIAKYFTLQEMGIPADKMRLTYVKALRLNQAHMVLTYFPAPDEDPLVLDNLEKKIRPASLRDDLLPVYSFNGNGLWLAKARFADSKEVGKANRLAPWRDVIARINSELAQ
jgi:predicted transglutaminase-like cysteine proteinase